MHRATLLLAAVALAGHAVVASPPAAERRGATVLYNDRSVVLTRAGADSQGAGDDLWVRKADLPRINEFELKPQGACRADVCIPVDKSMTRGAYFNLSAFARKVGETAVVDRDARVWSFGEIPIVRGQFVESRVAPDFSVADRAGHIVHLSDFRGRKVLVLTWASW